MEHKKININSKTFCYYEYLPDNFDIIILAIQGLGACADRYEEMGKFMADKGIAFYAMELDGFGVTAGERGHIKSFSVFYDQLSVFRTYIQKKHTNKKIVFLGESMGALIVSAYLEKYNNVDKAVLIVPPYVDQLEVPVWQQIMAAVCLFIYPKKRFPLPFKRDMVTASENGQNYLENSQNEVKSVTARFYFELLKAQVLTNMKLDKIQTPVFALQAEQDRIVNSPKSKKYIDKIPGLTKYKLYKGAYHSLCIDEKKVEVFSDILSFISS